MLARSQALISASALRANAQQLAQHAGAALIVPVKANAYGHGVAAVTRALADVPQVWGFAAAFPREAEHLAQVARGKPVLLLTPAAAQESPQLSALGVHISVGTRAEVEALAPGARAHLKVETGMNRSGARPAEAAQLGRVLAERGQLAGVYTHFARADEPDLAPTYQQLRLFQEVVAGLPPTPGLLVHAANGGGLLGLGQVPGLNAARPGLTLYGYPPAHLRAVVALRPALKLRARVGSVHLVQAGEHIGYGALYTAQRSLQVATAQFGYADGYPRNASLKAKVVVQGEVRPVLGRICMDQFMCDVSGLRVQPGDWLEVIDADQVTLSDVAAWGDTIEYEVLTGLGERIERVLVD